MAATASLPSSSLSSSQSLNSSDSSEGTCSFVVVEKILPLDEKVSQLNAEDKQEMKLNNESPVEAGSVSQEDLIQRVQGLTKENEELKGVLIQNNKVLEDYFKAEGTVLQAYHTSSETTQHGEREGADIKKLNEEILNLTHERDSYKKKLDALQTHLEAAKPSQEEVLGDADLKEKYHRVKKQLWKYQERDNYIQDKENALLEKEKAYTEKLAELCVKEEALTQEKQRHEEEIKILKKQLGETHEHEVLLLKEDLNTKTEAMAAVQTNEKCLREQLLKLQLENQNLVVECEKCRADCKKQQEETQSVKRQLSETHKKEYLLLKNQLLNKELALKASQTSEEHMKAQVTQLVQENQTSSKTVVVLLIIITLSVANWLVLLIKVSVAQWLGRLP
ncbi:girdin-like isoform X1 [Montipora capricornis]|uniref:girdin-like isoform X1 n=2 Tax=Montipora capricornis TaxID=246305 RepID=UPI0035F12661